MTGRAVAYSPPLKVELPLQYLLRESMGCGVSNEMPLVEEDAINKDLRNQSNSGVLYVQYFLRSGLFLVKFTTEGEPTLP